MKNYTHRLYVVLPRTIDDEIKKGIINKIKDTNKILDFHFEELLTIYKESIESHLSHKVKSNISDIFASKDNILNKVIFDVSVSYNKTYKQRFKSDTGSGYSLNSVEYDFRFKTQGEHFYVDFSNVVIDEKSINELISNFLWISFNGFIFFPTYIAPAERSAINIFSKELSLVKTRSLNAVLKANGNSNEMLDLLKSRVNRYPKPIRDNLEIAEDLANLSKQKSQFAYLAEELERDLLKGKIVISEHGQAEYLPDNEEFLHLELHLTGSIVKSLANIVFYLRHLAQPYDTIIIDEPELNLHPDNQRLIARFLGRLVNEGFKVIVSTHSDYIVRELNNMIMLSQEHENRDALLEKYGYQKNQLVKPEQVEALLFTKDSRKPTKIEVDESGLTVKTIDEVIEQMNISTEDIYFQLFEKVG
ncbi:MAG: AAA family ATPase [Chitinophagales bacterium]